MKCNIEELIKNTGYKKSYIADHLEVTVRQLRKYEKMDSLIPMDKAFKLAKLLGVKVDDLYEE
jgi:transcriptional regulator with XRE-family HTH domain